MVIRLRTLLGLRECGLGRVFMGGASRCFLVIFVFLEALLLRHIISGSFGSEMNAMMTRPWEGQWRHLPPARPSRIACLLAYLWLIVQFECIVGPERTLQKHSV